MPEAAASQPPKRLMSLDAYRGFMMLAMVAGDSSAGFLGLAAVAQNFPGSPFWGFLAAQSRHSEWQGCTFWDLIMPSFLFILGVAMPYSFARRVALGHSYRRQLFHAAYRSAVLIGLGIYLSSPWSRITRFMLTYVLSQIGLGYFFVFLTLGKKRWVQAAAAAGILIAYWLAFALYPLPGPGFDHAAVGIPRDYPLYTGLFAHWNKNANLAADFDRWFLNLFPQEEPHRFSREGIQTLNFIPSIATMIFGVIAGEFLRSAQDAKARLKGLILWGALGVAGGWLLGHTLCPIVKPIWTPSWTVFSSGWALLILAMFYWLMDLLAWRRWAFPLVVVGMNSLVMYCMALMFKYWVLKAWKIAFGPGIFSGLGGPVGEFLAFTASLWLVCWLLYRFKIFIRI